MPRGYLKRCDREVGRKNARGGSSGKQNDCRCKNHSGHRVCSCRVDPLYKQKRIFYSPTNTDVDFAIPRQSKGEEAAKKSPTKPITYPTAECPICFEDGPVIPMSGACGWHDAACYRCLHSFYMIDAPKDCSNYPLICYHPQCQNKVKWGQLQKHNLISSKEESDKYHEMMQKAKRVVEMDMLKQKICRLKEKFAKQVARRRDVLSIYCPHCDFPRLHRKNLMDRDRTLECTCCKKEYLVSPDYSTMAAIERFEGTDRFGHFDGCAKCPSCGIMISKGDGCDRMKCFCGNYFSWRDARMQPHAVVPHEQLYLWW